MVSARTEIDAAYGCYAFTGSVALAIAFASKLPVSSGAAGAFGFLIAIPLTLLSFAAMAVGGVIAIRRRRHWPLPVLAGLSIAFVIEMFGEFGSRAFYNAAPVLYGAVTLALGAAWFLFLRRRHSAG